MPRRLRNILLSTTAMALSGLAAAGAADSDEVGPGGGTASRPSNRQRGGIRREVPGQNEVLATITDGNLSDKVTRAEVITFLSRYPIPEDEDRQDLYNGAIERLVNTKLLMMFLAPADSDSP